MFRKRFKPEEINKDLDLLPIMNLFSILIPFLLSMAVFQKMAIVEVFLDQQNEGAPPEPSIDTQDLTLTLSMTEDSFQIWARGGALPKIFTKEIVEVRCKGDVQSHRHDRKIEKEIKCLDGSLATQNDYESFHVFKINRQTEDDLGSLVKVMRNANDSALLDHNREFIQNKELLKIGSVYQTLNLENTVRLDTKMFQDAKVDYLTAYDELSKVLQDLNQRFIDSPDANKIVILSSDKMEFDKIIQAMDVAKGAGFENVQLAKLGVD